jgi:hypothetical protein
MAQKYIVVHPHKPEPYLQKQHSWQNRERSDFYRVSLKNFTVYVIESLEKRIRNSPIINDYHKCPLKLLQSYEVWCLQGRRWFCSLQQTVWLSQLWTKAKIQNKVAPPSDCDFFITSWSRVRPLKPYPVALQLQSPKERRTASWCRPTIWVIGG